MVPLGPHDIDYPPQVQELQMPRVERHVRGGLAQREVLRTHVHAFSIRELLAAVEGGGRSPSPILGLIKSGPKRGSPDPHRLM